MEDLPCLPHLQYLALIQLEISGYTDGKALRQLLSWDKTTPAFYSLIDRLETAGLIEGRDALRHVEGQQHTCREYRLTEAGSSAIQQSQEFYRPRAA